MKNKPIIIVNGEPNSIFLEIFFKSLKNKNYKSPIILISSLEVLIFHMKKLKFKKKIKIINYENISKYKLNHKYINLINIKSKSVNNFKEITNNSNSFIEDSFDMALNLIKLGFTNKMINGPISKKNFLNKKYLGITEYLAKKSNSKKIAMLIYNKNLSVCPITTHLPLKRVAKKISKKEIYEKVDLINNFYKNYRNKKPKIAILGLNPHCESIDKFNEDEKITKPAVKYLKKQGYNVSGPFPADTIFLKNNRKNLM